jgi:alkylation response protein AidB-like acyl-CoA dehydrogenase
MMNEIEQVREGWRKKAQKVAREVVAPRAAKIDEEGEFPWDIAKVFHEEGFLSLVIPKEYGGMDGDITSLCVVAEEIAKFCASSSLLVIVQAVGTMPVALGGTEEMKKQFLGEIAREKKLIAFCITEPDSGSDAASIRTKATREEGHYLINGRKCFITNGGVADLYTVFAVTQPDKKMEGITGFLLEKGTPGLSIGKVEEKMGIRGSNTTEVLLEDVRASLLQRIGDEGVGWWLMMRTLNRSRPAIGAQAVGLAQGAVDTAVKFGQEKNWFRQRDDAVLIEAKLSDMIIEIEAAKALVYKAANMMDEKTKGVPVQMFSAMSKYFASDVAMKVTTDVVQLMEWQGLARDYPAERMMRDAKVIQIFEGTNQIQRMVVAHTLLKGK